MKLKVTFMCITAAALMTALGSGLGCSSSASGDSAASEISEADAKQKALAFVPGTAGATVRIETADEHRWAVTVATPGGGEAVVELERADGRLDEIKSEKGPFEYELPAAGPGVVTYTKARSVALETRQGQIEAWELDFTDSVWEFYVRAPDNQLWEIKLNALTAAVTSAKQKAERD